jgi:hypothetical protein
MVIDESFVDVPPRPLKLPQQPFQVRSEEEITIGSLALGTLMSGAILLACISAWLAVLIAPLWAFRSLLF